LKEVVQIKLAFYISLSQVAITTDNHIAYQQSGITPIRPNPQSGSYVKDGTNTKNDWLGFMPVEDRLSVIDPECGYIVTSNNAAASKAFYGGIF
jgi:acyl-homoserine lactone acylase PvdQ